MRIILEKTIEDGSVEERLTKIAEEVGKLKLPDEVSLCLFWGKKKIRGFVVFSQEGNSNKLTITVPRFTEAPLGRLEFTITKNKIAWDQQAWKLARDQLKWAGKYRLKGKRKYPEIKVAGLGSERTPVIRIGEDMDQQGMALQIGFYLVRKHFIKAAEILGLFEEYCKTHFPRAYRFAERGKGIDYILPQIVENWVTGKHHMGFEYHIGIYLENIKRAERTDVLPQPKGFETPAEFETALTHKETAPEWGRRKHSTEEESNQRWEAGHHALVIQGALAAREQKVMLKRHLYYLKARNIIKPKKAQNGRYKFTAEMIEQARKNLENRRKQKELAHDYAEVRRILYKKDTSDRTAQRWLQRCKKKGLNLGQITKLLQEHCKKKGLNSESPGESL